MLILMRTHTFFLQFPFGFLVLSLLAAGCDNPSSSTTGVRPVAAESGQDSARAKSDNKPRGVWPKNSRVQETEVELAPRKNSAEVPEERPSVAPPRTEVEEEKEVPPEKDPPIPDSFRPLNKEKTLFFEKTADGKRRVHILAEVCFREGQLEVFLCRNNTKEHESIVHTPLDGREIHVALIAAGAKFGSTVKFAPVYKPATGDTIKVSVTYHLNGKLLTTSAQSWIQDTRTKKEMPHDWVFAGSRFFQDPEDASQPPYYCANNGEFICIANFADSMMDLPVKSSKEAAELGYAAWTERIPPLKTKVIVTLEPVPAAKK